MRFYIHVCMYVATLYYYFDEKNTPKNCYFKIIYTILPNNIN